MAKLKRAAPITDEDIQFMVLCYENEKSARKIGELLDVNEATVRRHLKAVGVVIRPQFGNIGPGSKHNCWKGGERVTGDGYVRVYVDDDSPFVSMRSKHNKDALKHRLVMAQHLGRPLTKRETVHHKDGNPLNNELSNLQLRSSYHGEGQVRRCGDCGSTNIVCEEI